MTARSFLALRSGLTAWNTVGRRTTLYAAPVSIGSVPAAWRRRLIARLDAATGEAQQMAEMVGVGALDFGKIVTRAYPLAGINDALEAVKARPGGFINIVVHPDE